MRLDLTSSTILAIFLASTAHCNAGAVNEGAGRGLAISTQTTDIATNYLNPNGQESTIARYEKRERSLYFEFGLTNQLMVFSRLSRTQATLEGDSALAGKGPNDIGLQFQVLRRTNLALALQATAHLESRDLQPANWLYGQRLAEPELRALIGQNIFIAGKKNYYEAQFGFRKGRADRPDEIHLDITHAMTLSPHTSVMTQLFITRTTGSANLPAQAFEERKVQISFLREFGPYSLQIGTFHTSSGRNVYSGKGTLVSLWLRL